MELINRPVILPKLLLHVAFALAGLREAPTVLGPGNYYLPETGRTALQRRTLDTLTELDLARRGTLDPAFSNTLAVLHRPTREYYCWTHRSDDTAGAILIAARDRDAIRVITDHHTVLLDAITPHRLAEHLVHTLPEVPAAALKTVTIPRDAADPEPATDEEQDPLAEPAHHPHATRLQHYMRAERHATHQLYTAVRTTPTAPRRRSTPITALDLTDTGRILIYTQPDQHNQPTLLTLRAGTPTNLTTALTATHQHLQTQHSDGRST